MREENNSELKGILEILGPGTSLREGIENILRAKTGGLIVIGDNKEILETVDGGFSIGSAYSPANIYELAKMDGKSSMLMLSSSQIKVFPPLKQAQDIELLRG